MTRVKSIPYSPILLPTPKSLQALEMHPSIVLRQKTLNARPLFTLSFYHLFLFPFKPFLVFLNYL
jgi:hypothetical protein